MNFANFLIASFFTEQLRWLLLRFPETKKRIFLYCQLRIYFRLIFANVIVLDYPLSRLFYLFKIYTCALLFDVFYWMFFSSIKGINRLISKGLSNCEKLTFSKLRFSQFYKIFLLVWGAPSRANIIEF